MGSMSLAALWILPLLLQQAEPQCPSEDERAAARQGVAQARDRVGSKLPPNLDATAAASELGRRNAALQAATAARDEVDARQAQCRVAEIKAEQAATIAQLETRCPTEAELEAWSKTVNRMGSSFGFVGPSELAIKNAEREAARAVYTRGRAANERCIEEQSRASATADAKLMENPKAFSLAVSLNWCRAKQEEDEALASIKEEKANSKIAGVVSLSLLRELQESVVVARKKKAHYEAELKARKVKRFDCTDKALEAVGACASGLITEGCDEPTIQGLLRARAATEVQDW